MKTNNFTAQHDISLLQTKQHFKVLDGLRGVAAFAVVIFHFMEFIAPDYKDNFIAHAYLAVDFFFCLSGFVVAYAYDNKIGKIGKWQFFKLRLIRLHPLVFIGAIIGVIAFVFDPFKDLYSAYGSWTTLLLFLSSCFLVPYPIVHERYNNLFHLNPPTWSLFWEYVANIFYAFVLVRVNKRVLLVSTIIAAVVLVWEAKASGYLGVGWAGENFSGGGVRVFYSFLAGVLVFRYGWIISSRLGFGVISVMLFFAFLVPFTHKYDWLADALIVLIYFPLLIALGAGSTLSGRLTSVCNFAGRISYPLYMVHYPFLWIFMSYIETHKPEMSKMIGVTVVGVPVLVAFAYLIMKLVDEPVREWLKKRFVTAKISVRNPTN